MAKTPEAALKFMDALVPGATAKAASEGKDIQDVIDAQKGGFTLQPWDWDFYSEQVRKAKYDLNDAEVKPYFELNNVLENGVFYAANQLYGITFKERKDIPVYQPDVRVFEVSDADGKPLALFYCDYFKRDNKNGGAWMDSLRGAVKASGHVACGLQRRESAKARAGRAGTDQLYRRDDHVPRVWPCAARHVREHGVSEPVRHRHSAQTSWSFPHNSTSTGPSIRLSSKHYAKHYKTGAPMPAELVAKIRKAATFNQGYKLTELVAAAELDMQWHTLPASAAAAAAGCVRETSA